MGENRASVKEFYLLKLLNSLSLAVGTRFKIIQVLGTVLLLVLRGSSKASRAVFSQICLCAIYMLVYIQEETTFNV